MPRRRTTMVGELPNLVPITGDEIREITTSISADISRLHGMLSVRHQELWPEGKDVLEGNQVAYDDLVADRLKVGKLENYVNNLWEKFSLATWNPAGERQRTFSDEPLRVVGGQAELDDEPSHIE